VKREAKTDSVTQEIEVLPKIADPPDAAFSIQPRVIKVGEKVKLTAVERRSEVRHEWRIGDGSALSGASVEWTASQPGIVKIRHIATAEGGVNASKDDEFLVTKPGLVVVRFAATPSNGTAPLKVRFTSESEGEIAAYLWDFGDGRTSDLKSPEHTFDKPGSFGVRLSVRNVLGESSVSTEKVEIAVKAPLPPWLWPSVGAGIVLLLLALGYNAFLKPKPIEGTLVVEFGGARQNFPLLGTKFDLAEAAVGEWRPPVGQFVVRRKGGLFLFGTASEPIPLEHQQSFDLKVTPDAVQNARITYLAS
jgi:PKD repeat protein